MGMVADAKGKMNSLVDGLRRDIFDSYASIRHNVDQSLLAVGSCLRKMVDRETKELQRRVHFALSNAVNGGQELFVYAHEVVHRSLSPIEWYPKRDESPRPGSSSAHSANRGQRQSRARIAPDSGGAPYGETSRSFVPTYPGVKDPRDKPG